MTDTVAVVDRALTQIAGSEKRVQAWAHVDPGSARSQAATIDERVAAGESLPLAGMTVGVKDIIDVAGMPTGASFAPFAGRVATRDSTTASRLRSGGAAIVGKTTTTQFAVSDPTATRNPWNLERTPAGSSSGSAAAVAAGHVDFGIGTQTAGSTLRPASFCGIVGFKPSFGWISRAGVIPLADTLDTVGLMARSVAQIARLFDALVDDGLERAGQCEPEQPARIGFWDTAAQLAEPDVRRLVDAALRRAIENGAVVEEAIGPANYRDLLAVHHVTMLVDAAAAHENLIHQRPDAYGPRVRSFVETGTAIPGHLYVRAQILRREHRARALKDWAHFDVIALPTVDTPAPGLATTGSPALQAVVTLLGLPAISLPVGLSPDGLPIGLQLVAPSPLGNARLLKIARWLESLLDPLPSVPSGVV